MNDKTLGEFYGLMESLMAKHKLKDDWYDMFVTYIIRDDVFTIPAQILGLPYMTLNKNARGNWNWVIVTPPEVNLSSEITSRMLAWLREAVEDRPPQPQPMQGNTRKLDWQPVVEWHKRHPNVTQDEIARMLHRRPDTVRHKLSEFDAAK